MMLHGVRTMAVNNSNLARHLLAAITVALLTSAGMADVKRDAFCVDTVAKEQWTKALHACIAAAERGNANAQSNLGQMYWLGQGVKQDYQRAVQWYMLAARQGHAEAQFYLGLAFSRGDGVETNYKQSVVWYELAAAQGFAEAQHFLAWAYQRGEGVAKNSIKSYMWFNLAKAKGHKPAETGLGFAAAELTTGDISRAQEMSTNCRAKKYTDC